MYGYYGGLGEHSIWGGLFAVVLFVLLVVFIVRLIRWNSMSHFHHHHEYKENTALDILKERYAKGEINKEEFEIKKKDLNN
jgi:putative membrane protein